MKFHIIQAKEEIYFFDETPSSIAKLQDISLAVALIDTQLKDEYYSSLILHQNKYPKEYIKLNDELPVLKEYRNEQEISEDEIKITEAMFHSQQDFDLICKIISQGNYHNDGFKSWIYD
jgi:hypothetical protein